jgi:hypothetical protein
VISGIHQLEYHRQRRSDDELVLGGSRAGHGYRRGTRAGFFVHLHHTGGRHLMYASSAVRRVSLAKE